jgi:CRP/FNR family nitrogen fixation transcriptional regulator
MGSNLANTAASSAVSLNSSSMRDRQSVAIRSHVALTRIKTTVFTSYNVAEVSSTGRVRMYRLGAASGRFSVSNFKYPRGTEIFGEAELAEYIYQVIEGAVRTHKLLPDGRRQIGAFHFRGDIFGLENSETHRFTAEALVPTTVRLAKRESVEEVARNDPAILHTMLVMITNSLAHVENQMLLLGRKTSRERVAAFLFEMHLRSTAVGVLSLPMSRLDIADYLGLSIETVSRDMSELRRKDILKFEDTTHRHIVVLDVQAPAELAGEPDPSLIASHAKPQEISSIP